MEELWDAISMEREKLGHTIQRGGTVPRGEYHMLIHACIFNDEGQLLMQQRDIHKQICPGQWDVASVAGHVIAGEDSLTAAHREILEELGCDLDLTGEKPFFTLNGPNSLHDWYILRRNLDLAELTPQPGEVQDLRWVSREEALAMVDARVTVTLFRSFVEMLFDMDEYRAPGKLTWEKPKRRAY